MARTCAGDVSAFADLVRRHHSAARRLALVSGAGNDADDVVQEAFVRAFNALAGFHADAAFRPWLLRIVVNLTRNSYRSRMRRAGLVFRAAQLREDGDAVDPQGVVLEAERDRRLWAMLRTLPDKDRQVLGCRYLLDLSEAETAEVLGWPRGSVKSRTSRALTRLRALVEPELAGERLHG
ncbi:RNA polymerase sigma factor [Actinokineospora globicatena]|uniref:RNA polymerase sigma factor n=1 Tax=Actinokineospora globicatena TaxID=103729 RepID=UPI0020A39959|nr:RNA polymerase sigma factor [Actinokineospora globicatena]MCP2306494.1 RNA polymerase sigma-70 factor, ECF subfamily [Actinokineospora globicatena]GLW81923.1 RNA polymerase sigma factor [Actinokineospora globicatena]GLW88717.1 RNA polymerase sigma factor [Actinokineospora globicatena]